jgi:hypothetical protein
MAASSFTDSKKIHHVGRRSSIPLFWISLSLHFSSETVVNLVPVYCCCCHCSDPFFLLLFRLFKTKRRLLDTLTYYKRYYLVLFPSPSVQGFLCNKPSMLVISSSLL